MLKREDSGLFAGIAFITHVDGGSRVSTDLDHGEPRSWFTSRYAFFNACFYRGANVTGNGFSVDQLSRHLL